jgi:hypothetical protein
MRTQFHLSRAERNRLRRNDECRRPSSLKHRKTRAMRQQEDAMFVIDDPYMPPEDDAWQDEVLKKAHEEDER